MKAGKEEMLYVRKQADLAVFVVSHHCSFSFGVNMVAWRHLGFSKEGTKYWLFAPVLSFTWCYGLV